eukprot:gene5310-7198_t
MSLPLAGRHVAVLMGVCLGLTFTAGMLLFGPWLLESLGGRGAVLEQAVGYAQIFFAGGVIPWLMNTFAAILRGTGNMKLPSAIVLNSALCQIVLGGVLGLGLGPIPSYGMRGVAAGALIAYTIGTVIMGWYVFSGRARVRPVLRGLKIRRGMFFDILKVGAIACFSPLQNVLSLTIFTHMLARLGTDGRHGHRCGPGGPCPPCRLDGGGYLFRGGRPAGHGHRDLPRYLGEAPAPGAARVLGPVLAQTARLAFICAGGWWLISIDATSQSFFRLAAASMV